MKKDLIQAKTAVVGEWITLKKLAEETGRKIYSLRKLCRDGELPHIKPGGRIINVSRTEYNEWMCGNRIKTANELKSEKAIL